MTIEALIYTAIKTLCANRVYFDIAPMGAAMPYITFTQVGGEAFSHMANTVPDKQNGRFQFNVWGNSRSQCSALMAQIESAMVTSAAFQARPIGAPQSLYDADMQIFGSQCDFSVWSSR